MQQIHRVVIDSEADLHAATEVLAIAAVHAAIAVAPNQPQHALEQHGTFVASITS